MLHTMEKTHGPAGVVHFVVSVAAPNTGFLSVIGSPGFFHVWAYPNLNKPLLKLWKYFYKTLKVIKIFVV